MIKIFRRFKSSRESLSQAIFLRKLWELDCISVEVTPIVRVLNNNMNKGKSMEIKEEILKPELLRWVLGLLEHNMKEVMVWWYLHLHYSSIECLGILLLCNPNLIFFHKNYHKTTFFHITLVSSLVHFMDIPLEEGIKLTQQISNNLKLKKWWCN